MNSLLIKFGILALTSSFSPVIATQTGRIVNQALSNHSLAFLNPGNASGLIVGYAMACLYISLTARLLRLSKSVTLNGVLWWIKALTLLVAGSLVVKFFGQALVDKQFGFLASVTFAGLGVVQISRIKFPEYDFNQYVSGIRLALAKDITKACGALPWGTLPWGADHISERAERLHFLIFGNIGGGKTTYMKIMMAAVAPREGEFWVVFDPKIEIVPYLVALGKRPLILNPLDTRGIAWNICKDIVNSSLAEGFAELLIEDQGEQLNSNDDHWTLSARNILVALIEVFIASGLDWDLRDICLAINSAEDLIALLKRNPNASIIVQGLTGTHKSGANDYLLTVNTKLRPLHVIASRWHRAKERVSINEIVNNPSAYDNCALVLGTDHTAGKTITSLNEFLFERYQQLVMNTAEKESTVYRVWCDELSAVSRRTGKSLIKFMTKARSKGGSAVLLTQNEAGINERFGENIARQIFDTAVHKAVIGGVDGLTAKKVSEEVGEQDLIEADIGYANSNLTVDNQIDQGRSQKTEAQNIHQSFKRVRRATVPKERLLDSAMDSAGPHSGLHGFFLGGNAGPHFYQLTWDTVKTMQVEPDSDTQSYSRLDERSSDYQLTPWSSAERERWGLTTSSSSSTTDTDSDDPPTSTLPDWGSSKTMDRSLVLEVSGLSERELEDIAISRGLPSGLQHFSMEQINRLEIDIDTVTLTVEA